MGSTAEEARRRGAGNGIVEAIRLMEDGFHAHHSHDSGHTESRPTWIYTFPRHGGAQVALGLNKEKLSLYLSAKPYGRVDFESKLPNWGVVEEVYPNSNKKQPANSLLSDEHAPFLTPHRGRLVRFAPRFERLPELLADYLDNQRGIATTNSVSDDGESNGAILPASSDPREISPEMLRRSLDRNDATGRAGERLVYAAELSRLAALDCANPAAHVHLVADSNVSAGYDIKSEWDGETRFIEVKSSTRANSEFFITANERSVLTQLGERAWLYRVRVDSTENGGSGEVLQRLQNPMAHLSEEDMRPVMWRVNLSVDDGTQ